MAENKSRFGILDFIPRDREVDAVEAFKYSVELLKYADQLGLSRYWYAEHHSTPALLGSSPQVVLAYAAAQTHSIKLGTGGVMLDNLSAYQIAENFKALACLAPGRIEAGVGYSNDKERSDQEKMGGFDFKNTKPYEEVLMELHCYLTDHQPEEERRRPRAMPILFDQDIPMNVLVSSCKHIKYIAENGWGIIFGLFLNPDYEECQKAIALYRQYFVPNATHTGPHVSVAMYAVSSKNKNLIGPLEKGLNAWILAFKRNKRNLYQLLTTEESQYYPFTEEELKELEPYECIKVVGNPRELKRKFNELHIQLDCDEFLVINQLAGYNNRKELIKILSEIDK